MLKSDTLLGAFALEPHQVKLRQILLTKSEYHFDLVDGLDQAKEKFVAYRQAKPLPAAGRKKPRLS